MRCRTLFVDSSCPSLTGLAPSFFLKGGCAAASHILLSFSSRLRHPCESSAATCTLTLSHSWFQRTIIQREHPSNRAPRALSTISSAAIMTIGRGTDYISLQRIGLQRNTVTRRIGLLRVHGSHIYILCGMRCISVLRTTHTTEALWHLGHETSPHDDHYTAWDPCNIRPYFFKGNQYAREEHSMPRTACKTVAFHSSLPQHWPVLPAPATLHCWTTARPACHSAIQSTGGSDHAYQQCCLPTIIDTLCNAFRYARTSDTPDSPQLTLLCSCLQCMFAPVLRGNRILLQRVSTGLGYSMLRPIKT